MHETVECTPQGLLEYSAKCMGMARASSQPEACGTRYVGDGKTTKGYLWFYAHKAHFAVTKCRFGKFVPKQFKGPAHFFIYATLPAIKEPPIIHR